MCTIMSVSPWFLHSTINEVQRAGMQFKPNPQNHFVKPFLNTVKFFYVTYFFIFPHAKSAHTLSGRLRARSRSAPVIEPHSFVYVIYSSFIWVCVLVHQSPTISKQDSQSLTIANWFKASGLIIGYIWIIHLQFLLWCSSAITDTFREVVILLYVFYLGGSGWWCCTGVQYIEWYF